MNCLNFYFLLLLRHSCTCFLTGTNVKSVFLLYIIDTFCPEPLQLNASQSRYIYTGKRARAHLFLWARVPGIRTGYHQNTRHPRQNIQFSIFHIEYIVYGSEWAIRSWKLLIIPDASSPKILTLTSVYVYTYIPHVLTPEISICTKLWIFSKNTIYIS